MSVKFTFTRAELRKMFADSIAAKRRLVQQTQAAARLVAGSKDTADEVCRMLTLEINAAIMYSAHLPWGSQQVTQKDLSDLDLPVSLTQRSQEDVVEALRSVIQAKELVRSAGLGAFSGGGDTLFKMPKMSS